MSTQEDLDDLVQEVLLKVHRALSGHRSPSSFARWVATIARNTGVDLVRRRSVRRSIALAASDAAFTELPDIRLGPETLFDSAALRLELKEALNSLSPDLRLAVAMRYFMRMSTKEVAAGLACPEGTVKSRLHTALSRLRAHIERASQ